MKKVELLSPAGNYETMVGAFNAGADAVYLGGTRFGARAYADNFDRDQVLDAISYAHLHGKKIYMTVNTLVKEREYCELYDFMQPFAEKKLDGVIVQDFGVMRLIRKEFPEIELHASTQQTVTGVYGARLLKDLGCVRVVPARELSLQEMKDIREKADIEVEAFIHGAMCYCYSGACLFSSMVGGRSGNRGRCAQPCRLPYRLADDKSGREEYPLSLKDMCTVDLIPELIEAGIDSFKIEGRMKRPEYSAGVTSLYRKYIDLYYKEPDKKHDISREDMEILKSLYLRTGISNGYYHRHNGKEMVTIESPAYNGTSDQVLASVKEKYLDTELKIKSNMACELVLGEKARITMTTQAMGETVTETVWGNVVEAASKRPMDKYSVLKQLSRLGNTPFEAADISVMIDDKGLESGIFVPVSELNELRRSLCDKVMEKIQGLLGNAEQKKTAYEPKEQDYSVYDRDESGVSFDAFVLTREQLEAIFDKCRTDIAPGRVYVDSLLYLSEGEALGKTVKDLAATGSDTEFIVALPYISREESWDQTADLETIAGNFRDNGFLGVLVRNLEQLGYYKEHSFDGKVILDYGVYNWNAEAVKLLLECNNEDPDGKFIISEISAPLELNIHELKDMAAAVKKDVNIPISFEVYGRVPMMISAGCVKKTTGSCSGQLGKVYSEKLAIVDRMDNVLNITTNCRNCYNVIWNAHPTALHKKLDSLINTGMISRLRMDFTTEDGRTVSSVYDAFTGADPKNAEIFNSLSYTTGHFKRGVE